MTRMRILGLAAPLLWAGLFGAAYAADKAPSSEPVYQNDGTVVSHHSITLANGKHISYTARAGFLPLRRDGAGDNDEIIGEMFFTAYTADPVPGAAPRPITFRWGGGPGNGAAISSGGPRKMKDVKDYKNPPPPYEVVDNPETWLDITDLVMIDEMGTGYSRMTKPEYAPLFFSRQTDAEAFTEFMRIYIRRYDTANAPIFLEGGSYGSVRGARVADTAERRGIPVRGMVLSASAILNDLESTDIFPPLRIPTYTSTAFFYKKLPADLMADRDKAIQEAETWASGAYTAALGRGNTLSPEERKTIVDQMVRYTGLTPEVIEKNNLRVNSETFDNSLLRSEGKVIGNYDTRISVVSEPKTFNPTTDPSLNARGAGMPSLMERLYLSRELGVTADRFGARVDSDYLGPFGGAWPPVVSGAYPHSAIQSAEWMAVHWESNGDVGYEGSLDSRSFYDAIQKNKNLHVLLAGGKYDLATPFFNMVYLKNHVANDARDRVDVIPMESGHGVPNDQLHEAARKFYQKVLAIPVPPSRR